MYTVLVDYTKYMTIKIRNKGDVVHNEQENDSFI